MTRLDIARRTMVLILATLTLAACDRSGPVMTEISLISNPNPTVPLAAILSVAADEAATLTINIDDGERQWSVSPTDESAMSF